MNSSNNNHNKDTKAAKPCPNRCKKWIAYNVRLNKYIQVDTGQIHKCPKWNPIKQQRQQQKTRKQTSEININGDNKYGIKAKQTNRIYRDDKHLQGQDIIHSPADPMDRERRIAEVFKELCELLNQQLACTRIDVFIRKKKFHLGRV